MPGYSEILGKSLGGQDLVSYANFPPGYLPDPRKFTLIIGGTHGDERATVPILENFIAVYLESERVKTPVVVIPVLNPDGYAGDSRYNGRGVDLNRNLPYKWSVDSDEPPGSAPLSEPETQALYDFILARRPAKIVSLHWALAEIDADGAQSIALAKHVWGALTAAEKRPYRLRLNEGIAEEACWGSLGQWCGYGLVYPDGFRPAMITLELPYDDGSRPRPEVLPADHFRAVRKLWMYQPQAYLTGVTSGAQGLLEAACEWEHSGEADADPVTEAGQAQITAGRRRPVRE